MTIWQRGYYCDVVPINVPEPTTPQGRAGLAAVLARPSRALIASDFDGTLAQIVPDPTATQLAPGALDILQKLAQIVGQVAIITGRRPQRLIDGEHLDVVSNLRIEGQHGAESYRDGHYVIMDPHPAIAAVRKELPALLSTADPEIHVEDKGIALVIHTRPAAHPQQAAAALVKPIQDLANSHGLLFAQGRMALEVRPPGIDKGGTLRRLVDELQPSAVLMAGDDLGDVSAFMAVEELREQGLPGITVASRSEEVPEVAQKADLAVDGPDGVVAFFQLLVAAIQSTT